MVFSSPSPPQLLPIEGTRGPESFFSVRAILPYFLGDLFFLRWVPRPSSVDFYDLHRCSGSILSSPISQRFLIIRSNSGLLFCIGKMCLNSCERNKITENCLQINNIL